MPAALTVYIVEDDAAVRDSLSLMLGLAGYPTALFADAEAFLAAYRDDWAGCVVADLRLPGKSGLELQAELRARERPALHRHDRARRRALRPHRVPGSGGRLPGEAFRPRPAARGDRECFSREQLRLARAAEFAKLATLTEREREVLEHAAQGLHAKEIAAELGISPRTVEVHKTRIMEKLGVRNVAELVRFALGARDDARR